MKSLNEITWLPYKIDDIFSVKTGANISKSLLSSGILPRITASDMNNGVDEFTGHIDSKNFRTYSNSISISFLGSCFYQPYEASYDMKIHNLHLKKRLLNRYIALFIACQCRRAFREFNYGNQLSSSDLPEQLIFLPAKTKSEPDFDFMEQYMKEKERIILLKYKQRLLTQSNHIEAGLVPLDNKMWSSFEIAKIFPDIQRGKRLKNGDHVDGTMPYVSSSAMNNGVDDFVSNSEKVRIFSDCLSIANSGSVGATFYHPYSFVASDHVTKMRNPQFSRYVYLFIATITKRFSEKYNFNHEINENRIQEEVIILPSLNGQPDFQYMDSYMRVIEAKMINQYIDRKLQAI